MKRYITLSLRKASMERLRIFSKKSHRSLSQSIDFLLENYLESE